MRATITVNPIQPMSAVAKLDGQELRRLREPIMPPPGVLPGTLLMLIGSNPSNRQNDALESKLATSLATAETGPPLSAWRDLVEREWNESVDSRKSSRHRVM